MKKLCSILLVCVMLVGLSACNSSTEQPPEQNGGNAAGNGNDQPAGGEGSETGSGGLTFGLVVMSTNSDYWLTLKDGAQEAVDAAGGELVFVGPADNNDIQGQVALVENLVNSKVDAILLTPLDGDALVAPVDKAMDAGIPVIIIDSGISSDNYVSFIATDNVAGGKLAMETLVDLMGGEGEAVIINALAGIPSNDNRGIGAEQFVEGNSDIVLLPQQHCLDQAEALNATENVLTGNPNLKGIFATFNRGALGSAQALINKGKAEDVVMVAFDADADEIKFLEDGVIDALVVQQPYEMGKMGIEYALKAINGEDVPKEVAPDVVVATKDNMNDAAVHKVLFPND